MLRARAALTLSGGVLVVLLAAAALGASEKLPVPVPYAPMEPEQPYVPEAMDSATRLLVRFSHRAARHGDLVGAIELMQTAANTLVTRQNEDFELWDNLAELYCAQARREKDAKRANELRLSGRAMLAEFRCGERVMSGSRYDMSCVSKRGIVPNPSFTPLCYQVFCGEGPRDKGAAMESTSEDAEAAPDLFALYLKKFREDAFNAPSIEALCRAGK